MSDERWPIGHPGVSDPDEDEKWVRAYEQQHEIMGYHPADMELGSSWDEDDQGEYNYQADRCAENNWQHDFRPSPFDTRYQRCAICGYLRKRPEA